MSLLDKFPEFLEFDEMCHHLISSQNFLNLSLINSIKHEHSCKILYIWHDISVMCHDISVIYHDISVIYRDISVMSLNNS